jgi:plasmid stability protein
MDQLLIGDIEEELVCALERRAQANGRNREEEAYEILCQVLEEEETASDAIE